MKDERALLDLETMFAAAPGSADSEGDPERLARTGHVVFEYQDGIMPYYEIRAFGPLFPELPGREPPYVGRLERDEVWMLGMIHDCLADWEEYIAKYYDVPRGAPAFVPDRLHLESAGIRLSEAGERLFSVVFLQGDAGLRRIGEMLVEAMRTGEQVLSFYSDRLFVPWWIMYNDVGADGMRGDADWSPRGFWGYSHLIEHDFVRNTLCPDHRIALEDTPLQVSLNLDLSLDNGNDGLVTGPVRDFFKDRKDACDHTVRSTSRELRQALMSREFRDQVVYFCCHCGIQQGPYGGPARSVLQLTDEAHITPGHLCEWLRERNLTSNPFVFINACGGGLLSSQFYCSFGHELIRKAANCVIGPQVRIPAVFAGTYAVELFSRFLEPHCHLGRAMRAVSRHLMDNHYTPLGLVYGLYRGLDTRLVVSGVG
ncbi:MAG TPA: hypothetical protein VNF47_26695 [Streptosporangiaceae bacterium]|nr:hypothetical protein [Streptosporangiaceae bacterium]